MIQGDSANDVAVVGAELKGGSRTIHSEDAGISQKAGGAFAQRAAVDGGAARVGVGLVENENARMRGVADGQTAIGEDTIENDVVDVGIVGGVGIGRGYG